jgi:uncharacterized protein (TIGR02145 family)
MKKILFIISISASVLNLAAQDKFTDPRDGNSYRTIKIEGVTWMAENLKYKDPGNEAYYFDNNPNNISSYGVLYEWKTAMKACPDGWHLPSGAEFRTLINQFEVDEAWGKSASGPVSFRIQLAGMQDYEGTFTEIDESGYYWTSTEYNNDDAEYFSYMIINGKAITDVSRKEDMPDIHGAEKSSKYSVRCVKNQQK